MNNDVINQSLRRMASAPNGGHSTCAAMLGLTCAALENRLYGIKGQQISIEQAMLLQRLTESTDFAEAVAQESGGVFVALPELDEAAMVGLDIQEGFLNLFTQLANMVQKHSDITQDGRVTKWESAVLWREVSKISQQLAAVAVMTDRVYGVFYGSKK
nr:MAG TPA: regulatory protein [Caudoviricetes sp.]